VGPMGATPALQQSRISMRLSYGQNETSPQQAAGYHKVDHFMVRHHGFSPSSLYTVTPEQAQRNHLNETSPQQAAGYHKVDHFMVRHHGFSPQGKRIWKLRGFSVKVPEYVTI